MVLTIRGSQTTQLKEQGDKRMYKNYIQKLQQMNRQVTIKEVKNEVEAFIKELQNHSGKVKVINAGLVKAGKSAVFNALASKEVFKTDVVRATASNDQIELEKYILVDTPGLDANGQDDQTAFSGYKEADYLIFVHNVMEGELNKIEVESIKKIADIVGGISKLFGSAILVLSHADQIKPEELAHLEQSIKNQCQQVFGEGFAKVVEVNSISYMKGILEGKDLLKQASHIEELKEAIDHMVNGNKAGTLFSEYVRAKAENVTQTVEKTIQAQEECLALLGEEKKGNMGSLSKEIEAIGNKAYAKLKDDRINVRGVERPYCGSDKRSYREYKSESEARSAARSACDSGIHTIIDSARQNIRAYIEWCREYTELDGKIGKYRGSLVEAYNEMKETYYKAVGNLDAFPECNIALPKDESVKSMNKEIEHAVQFCTGFDRGCLQSTNYYLTAYSCNLDIDYDYRTEYVSGLFGSREREYKVYTWDISGALDDAVGDAYEFIQTRQDTIKERVEKLFKYQMKHLQTEFDKVLKEINKVAAKNIQELEKKGQALKKQRELHHNEIQKLQQLKNILGEVNA